MEAYAAHDEIAVPKKGEAGVARQRQRSDDIGNDIETREENHGDAIGGPQCVVSRLGEYRTWGRGRALVAACVERT